MGKTQRFLGLGLSLLLICGVIHTPAHAERYSFRLGKIHIDQTQQEMLRAAQMASNRQFNEAAQVYSMILQQNNRHIPAYIQRSFMMRELDRHADSKRDAGIALQLVDQKLQQKPDNAELYYYRGTAYRLLHQFADAKTNMQHAIRLSGKRRWETDLHSITLEEKMYGHQASIR